MEMMAAGIEAEVKIPIFKARYAFDTASTAAKIIDKMITFKVISGKDCAAGMKGFSESAMICAILLAVSMIAQLVNYS